MTPCYLPSQVKMPESAEPPNLEMSKELQDIISEDTLWLQEQGSASWAIFHSHRNQPTKTHADISSMLPIRRDNSKSATTIRHTMSIIAQVIQCINPGQKPVIVFDQPLYAIAKKLQWYYPHQYGTGKFVIMMGALQIEMSTLSALGA